jgi:formate hydrogenlyase subunit 3/multisubunit Na+/H+ antiporter MnhD subunit
MTHDLPLSLLLAYAAVLAALGSAGLALGTGKIPGFKVLMFILLGVAGAAAVSAGLVALTSPEAAVSELPLGLPWLPWRLRLDALAGFFMLVIGLVVMAVAGYGPGYVRDFEHGQDPLTVLGVFTGLFVAGMLLVVLADDAFLFMVAWELMSLSSYFLVAFQHEQAANRRAAFLYLLMAHIGALSILLGYGVLAGFGDGFAFDTMRAAHVSPLWGSVAFGLAFAGFGMKAGLVPMHAWLPEAHPAAPSHISALMSGVMLKVAVYGFIRFTFDLVGQLQWQWGVVVLVVGSVSALMGVLYALMQHDLKRLLAYHSVENIGIIFIGLGLGLIFLATGHPTAGVLGLIAALYHTLNHALFKSLLFLGAGAILHATHERDLERMGGLLRRMPWTGLFFLVGCISISALPPFNGFVSEWLTFQTALQAWLLQGGVMRSLIPIAAAVLALTGALAAACFVKVYGVAFLGQARSRRVRRARPVSYGMRMAQGFLATLCLLAGVFPTTLLQWLNAVPGQLLGRGLSEATAHGWLWLTPIAPQTASYSAPIVLLALIVVWWLSAAMLRRGRVREVRRCDPWGCGFSNGLPTSRMQYTATAFAQPIRRVFGLLFHLDERVEQEKTGLRYQLHVADRAWGLFYAPIVRWVQAAARRVSRLQSGHIRVYLGWSLGTLLVLLWMIS